VLTTKRLRMRLWRDEDLAAFAALNSDPRVMRYMPKVLDRAESDASAEVMTTSVTAPLERQLGQMPSLEEMSSLRSADQKRWTSAGGGWVRSGKQITMDLPLPLFLAEDE
jgi:hypothetical protein